MNSPSHLHVLRQAWLQILPWIWRNPFYLASAALFLFGIEQLSVDPNFLGDERLKLLFNFGALHLYETLLVGIAVFLARRGIEYDAHLLAIMEAALFLVQFILISHAALIEPGLARQLSTAGLVLAAVRLGAIRRWVRTLAVPGSLVLVGAVALLTNALLPFTFQTILDRNQVQWENLSPNIWWFALPAMQLLGNLLPRSRPGARASGPDGVLPFLIHHLWIAATAVHVRCIDYFSLVPFTPAQLAPLLWGFAWTCYRQFGPALSPVPGVARVGLLALPMVAAIPALWTGNASEFFAFSLSNVLGFAALRVVGREGNFVLELAALSCAAALAALPADWGLLHLPDFARYRWVLTAICAYGAIRGLVSIQPSIGLCSAIMAAAIPHFLFWKSPFALILQVGFCHLLGHSLRWRDAEQPGARLVRITIALLWAAHSLEWTYEPSVLAVWTTSLTGGLLAVVCGLARYGQGRWPQRSISAASLVSLLAAPANLFARLLQKSPIGLLALGTSIALLALGTFVAIRRHRCALESGRSDPLTR